ncbi:MAG: TolC family protein [Spongiibacteraceae bacterium]
MHIARLQSPCRRGRQHSPAMALLLITALSSLFISLATAQGITQNLTLNQAISKTLEQNPQLHQFALKKTGLLGLRDDSDTSPALNLGLEVDNIAGSGTYSGTDAAETTLALSSVLELGAKRSTRLSVADARLSMLEYQRQAFTLNILGELTALFIETLQLQALIELAQEAQALADSTLSIVKNRSQQGATSDAEVKRAAATQALAQLQLSALQRQHQRALFKLANFWGESMPRHYRLSGNLYRFSEQPSYPELYERAMQSPAIAVFASEARLKTAEVDLARTQSSVDLNWQIGIRRFEQSGDSALVAGVSIPLFSGRRNSGAIKSALADRDQVELNRQAALLRLNTQLFTAYSQRQQHINAVTVFQTRIIPNLASALSATQRAYEAGRYSYQDWIAAQQALLQAKKSLIESAAAASLNQATIEQLIAEPF